MYAIELESNSSDSIPSSRNKNIQDLFFWYFARSGSCGGSREFLSYESEL